MSMAKAIKIFTLRTLHIDQEITFLKYNYKIDISMHGVLGFWGFGVCADKLFEELSR